MAKKFTKVTDKNIHLILHRVKQFILKHECIADRTCWGTYPKTLNKYGISDFMGMENIEWSNASFITSGKCNVSLQFHEVKYISISMPTTGCPILSGDYIYITPQQIIIRSFQIGTNHGTSYLIPYANIEKAKRHLSSQEEYQREYYNN